MEFRSPDEAANPYLTLAVCLAAGLAGVQEGMDPGPPMSGNQHEMSNEERAAAEIRSLPRDMRESIRAFRNSEFMKEILGEHIFNMYLNAKTKELQSYQSQVTDWEINEYLYKI